MARFAVGVVFGLVVGTLAGAAAGLHADEVADAAEEANVDVTDLQGAMNTTGLDARTYLIAVGELKPPAPVAAVAPLLAGSSAIDRRIDCLVRYESGGNPNAINPRSGASGLLQFLPSTWRTTPQGRAGLSVFDPIAARAAAAWMLAQGRAFEWVPVQRGLC